MDNYTPIISIIVAVYNGQEYLERCISSILQQTFTDFEIILIDDGSIDNTPSLCDKLKCNDHRIKVIHQQNAGLSYSRNKGILNAKGEFIGFVDADDWISKDMYSILYTTLRKYNADICSVKYEITSDTEIKTDEMQKPTIEVLHNIDKLRKYLEVSISNRSNLYSACTKLYRKTLFDDIHFPEGRRFEDMVTNFRLIDKAESFVIIDTKKYYYYMNSTGITRNCLKEADLDLVKSSKEIYEMTKNTEIEDLGEVVYGRSFYSNLLKYLIYGLDNSIEDEKAFIDPLYSSYCKYYRKLIKSDLPLNRRLIMPFLRISPYIMRSLIKMIRRS